jgi:hypothetical protein
VYKLMKGLKVLEVSQLPGLDGGYIFNTPEFQSLKVGSLKFYTLNQEEKPIARICFTIEHDEAISGLQATFGSIDSDLPLSIDRAVYFLGQVCDLLKSEVEKISIKHWPECYDNSNNWQMIFEKAGFNIVNRETDQYLKVTEKDYYQVVNRNQLSNLKQARDKGYTFSTLDIHKLPIVYGLIKRTLERKGYPVSMTHEDLYKTISLLPERYLLFGVMDNDKLIAAAISVRVSKEVLYNFYHADEFNYRSTSPMVMLIKEIYEYCQRNEIQILDLGISTENGLINQGLFNFKKSLGCYATEKNTYGLSYD